MSKYTTELRYIVESKFDLGLKDYIIYKEVYRETLNKKILDHYYFREIGLETPAMFKMFLNRKMNEIMPFYNQLYKSADIEFNPLWNVEMHETFSHTTTDNGKTTNVIDNVGAGTTTNDSTTTDTGKVIDVGTNSETQNNTDTITSVNEDVNVLADTPQSALTDSEIKAHTYATKTEHNKNNTSNTNTNTIDIDKTNNTTTDTTNTGTNNTDISVNSVENTTGETNTLNTHTEEYTRLTEGSSAGLPYSNAIKQWRQIMINIDMQIVEELEPLFMQLW